MPRVSRTRMHAHSNPRCGHVFMSKLHACQRLVRTVRSVVTDCSKNDWGKWSHKRSGVPQELWVSLLVWLNFSCKKCPGQFRALLCTKQNTVRKRCRPGLVTFAEAIATCRDLTNFCLMQKAEFSAAFAIA